MVSALWLAAAIFVTVRLYHQLPHIVDAQAYYFQSRIFEAGRTWLQIPSIVDKLDGFQQVEWNGRWFGQYPPGAPALYALGGVVGLAWLVGPLSTLALLLGTLAAGWLLYDRAVALTALALLAISPFVLFQAGSFMSHPIAGGAVACSLAAFAYGVRAQKRAAFVWVGALLGLAFNAREVAAVLYGLAYAVWLLAQRQWRPLVWIGLAALPLLVVYLLFNASTTGDPLTLPRSLFNPNDRWGFGAVGTGGQHTVAAGLENTDENLTLLQFDLFGWPPLAALALVGLPFLLGRPNRFDVLLALCAAGFVVAYVGYFYSGIALGPRYYFEAVPALALLAARGVQTCVQRLRELGLGQPATWAGAGAVLGLLCAWTVVYYLPHAVDRRMDFAALGGGKRLVMPFVATTLGGPQLTGVDPPALVLVSNGDVFKSLSALNCPRLEDAYLDQCPVLLVNTNVADAQKDLYARFPGRSVWLIDTQGDLVTLQRVRNST
jgi:4-amino-4-deoxy-L-arabinose transferase-like glycosyltransferase